MNNEQYEEENGYGQIKQNKNELRDLSENNGAGEMEDSGVQSHPMKKTIEKGRKPHRKMGSFGKGLITGIFAGFIVTVLLVTGVIAATADTSGIGSQAKSKLNTINSLLGSFYFDAPKTQDVEDNICKAYLESYGDKYTVYYTADEYKTLVESTTGTFYGIGAVCQKADDGTILVTDAYEDAPAYKAGIRDGDAITKVNGQDVTDMDLSAAVALIKGKKGTTVDLEVLRNGETFTVTVTRDEVKAQTVSYKMLDNNIGYLYISQFDTVTTDQFKAALNALKADGMQSLVIDIRNNPGGVLGTVVNMLDEILPDGLIVYTEDKSGNRTEYNGSNSDSLTVPMAVLVNGNSASASEIFAGAVQDYGIGKIIGTQTFGKGIVQTIQPLSDGSAVKFTIAKYFTPKGQDIHGHGVTPDQVVELPDDATTDTQLNAALDYLNGEMAK